MTPEETEKVCALLFKSGSHNMNAKFVGRSPQVIAEAAKITIPAGTRVLIGEQGGVGEGYPLSYEKLTTVLAFYTVRDWREACELASRLPSERYRPHHEHPHGRQGDGEKICGEAGFPYSGQHRRKHGRYRNQHGIGNLLYLRLRNVRRKLCF